MPRKRFDEQLKELNQEMIKMGTLCEDAIKKSSDAALNGNMDLACELPDLADQMNIKDREIESICMKLLLQQQPVAGDLRYVSSALKIVTDMKRIVIQSADIADIVKAGTIDSIPPEVPLSQMASSVIHMVSSVVDAFVRRDAITAREVIRYDDEVDTLFDDIKNKLIEVFRTRDDNKADGAKILDILMISKYMERIGDHAVNIAGWVCYSVTGTREVS